MYLKMLGGALLLVGLILGVIIVTDVQVFYRVETFAKAEQSDGDNRILVDIIDTTVDVPPYNSSEGWVGFNITLPNQEKAGYEAFGVVLPADQDLNPWMAMFAVNESGADLLAFDHFTTETWNVTKVYAKALLDSNYKKDPAHGTFRFHDLEDLSRYILLFRVLKDEDKSRPFLLSIKESWLEHRTMLEANALTVTVVSATVTMGTLLVFYDLISTRRKRIRRGRQARRKTS